MKQDFSTTILTNISSNKQLIISLIKSLSIILHSKRKENIYRRFGNSYQDLLENLIKFYSVYSISYPY